jgi:hypothetical protein
LKEIFSNLQNPDRVFGKLDALKAVVAFKGLRPQLGDVVGGQVQLDQDLQIAKGVFVDSPKLNKLYD